MVFLTFAEIEKNLENYGLENLKLDILNERLNLLKRDIKIELATSDNHTKEIKKQIIRFEEKFDLDNSKWFFEDLGGYGMDSLRNWYSTTEKSKEKMLPRLPQSIKRWYDIDPSFEKMGDIALRELYNDLKILEWLYGFLPPSVSKTTGYTQGPSVLITEKTPKQTVIKDYKKINDRYKWHIKQDKLSETAARLKVMENLNISKSKFYNAVNYCKALIIN
jgi:hypothetical protein